MNSLAVVALYLGAVLALGLWSHRRLRATSDDFWIATRSIGPVLLLTSLFGTHMTAFSLLGASGEAYRRGIGVFALMASSSALVVPVALLLLAPRVWELGRRHGFLNQLDLLRARWASEPVALLFFALVVLFLLPYLVIGVKGGGIALHEISKGAVAEWVGSFAMCGVVLAYVTAGGLRGTAWANALQTVVFTALGVVSVGVVLGRSGGLGAALAAVRDEAPQLLVPGASIRPLELVSYIAIPLSVASFPHLFMHWLTAREARSFRLPVLAYPTCVALVWLPSVLLGVLGAAQVPGLVGPEANSVLLKVIDLHAGDLLAGLLAAGVFAAVMSSLDSQSLALSGLFAEGLVRRWSGDRLDEGRRILLGRAFVVTVLATAFVLSILVERSIFRMGVWSFSGFTALAPVVIAALFWRRATAAGALASLVTTAALWTGFLVRSWSEPGYTVGGTGVMPVVAMLAASTVVLAVVSGFSRPPEPDRLAAFFPAAEAER